MLGDENKNIRQQFEQIMQTSFPKKLITNFIIIAEIVDNDTSDLAVSVSDGMSPWLASGMLDYASNMMMSTEYKNNRTDEND